MYKINRENSTWKYIVYINRLHVHQVLVECIQSLHKMEDELSQKYIAKRTIAH